MITIIYGCHFTGMKSYLSAQAILIDIALLISGRSWCQHCSRFAADNAANLPSDLILGCDHKERAAYLRQDDDFIPREIVLLDGLPKDSLRSSIGVHISCIKGIDALVVSTSRTFDERWSMQVAEVKAYAYLICFIPSSSSSNQGIQSVLPYDIAPRMILETFRPDDPRLTDSLFCCEMQ